jgi:hypothetical protein
MIYFTVSPSRPLTGEQIMEGQSANHRERLNNKEQSNNKMCKGVYSSIKDAKQTHSDAFHQLHHV